MLPDLSLPSLNDAGGSVTGQRDVYEFANKVYNDSLFDWVLKIILDKHPRNSMESLIDGVEYDNSTNFVLGPISLPNMGISTIRNDDFCLVLDYGSHGGKYNNNYYLFVLLIV